MKKILSVILTLALLVSAFAVAAIAVDEDEAVAKIGDTYYATLADAVKAVAKNETATIELLCDHTISSIMVGHQYVQNITIDLNGHKLSSSGKALTSYRSGTVLTLQNGTVSGNTTGGTICATYGGKLVLGDDLNVACAGGSATAIKIDNGTLVVSSSSVTATTGKASFSVSSNENNKVEIAGGTYKTAPLAEWIADGCAVVPNTDGTYTVKSVEAKIGNVYFDTLAEAIDAAVDGDLITIVKNITVDKDDVTILDGSYNTFFCIAGKTVTIDLAGKSIYADAAGISGLVVGVFSTEDNGHLTLEDSVGTATVKEEANGANVYALIVNYDPTSTIIINGGNYSLDKASDSLLYTGGNEGITVNGGTFNLDNVGTGKNQSPWIFNAKGQNTAHVLVYGGTFNADIQHQYYPFEVLVDKACALKTNEDGTKSIVTAVAYVNEQEFSGRWYTNEVGYATLEEAIAAVEAPKTNWDKQVSRYEYVTLLADVLLTSGESITIPAGKDITIDLAGHSISQTKVCTAHYSMISNYGKLTIDDSNGTGKISFTDIGNGDASFGWGSYTLANYGTLVVEGGTIENLTTLNDESGVSHMYSAIHQGYGAVSTTINGGKISNPTYRSIRINNGALIINGGECNGQIWMHPFANGTSITINGGSFNPCGVDGSSVYVENGTYDVELSVTGGEFATKIGCANANKLVGVITGGEFTEAAKLYTNPLLFAEDFEG